MKVTAHQETLDKVRQTPAGLPDCHSRRVFRVHGRNSFTLIELLVVVAIIMLLAALLLPAIRHAKDRAKTIVCASNLKHLGLTFHLYAGDYGGWLPHITHDQWGYAVPIEWFLLYTFYLRPAQPLAPGPRNIYQLGKLKPVFDCPATGPKEASDNVDGAICFCGPESSVGYVKEKPFDYMLGYASRDSDGLGGKKLTDLEMNRLLLIDHQANAHWVAQTSPVEGLIWNTYYPGTGFWPYLPGFHHDNGANILFPDGRVKWHKRKDYQPLWESGVLWMYEVLPQ